MTMQGFMDVNSAANAVIAVAPGTAANTFGGAQPRLARTTVTFDGTSGKGLHGTNTTWFTVTGGLVRVIAIAGRVTTNVTGASSTATLGVTGSTSLFIGATTGTALLTSAEIWVSTTPTTAGLALPGAVQNIVIDANILSAMHATNDITGGVIEMNCIWSPITPGATLT